MKTTKTVSDLKTEAYKFNEIEHGNFRILITQKWEMDDWKTIHIIHQGISQSKSKVSSLYWKGTWTGSFIESVGVAVAVLNGDIELIKEAMKANHYCQEEVEEFFAKNPNYFDINQGQ